MGGDSTVNTDPIILAIQPSLLSLSSYSAYSGNNWIYFSNNINILDSVKKIGISVNKIPQINSVYNQAINQITLLTQKQYNDISAIILAILILCFTSVIISMLYCDANGQSIFIQFSNGLFYWRIFSNFILSVFLLNIFSLLISVYKKHLHGINNLAIALFVIILNLLVVKYSTNYYLTKIKADYIKRY
jgi:hypothetical protein